MRPRPFPATAYWWQGVPNFGDALAPLLLAYHADLDVTWAEPRTAQIAVIGSILEHLPETWDGYVCGCGKLHENSVTPLTESVRLKRVLAIRGPLSAKGIKGDFALGDAGLLADELIKLPPKRHTLGIVAHWSDKHLASRPEFTRYEPLIIDPGGDPLTVIKQIASCRKIISSSLHGLIVADTFAIPRRFEVTPRFEREGGLFKFRDYHASINTPFEIGRTIEASRFGVDDRRFEVHDAFRALSSIIRADL